jgi:hypothetical protein
VAVSPHSSSAELEQSWQVRALRQTRLDPLGMAVLSVIADSYDEALPWILCVAFPGFAGLTTPAIVTSAKISKSGRVVADVVWNHYDPIAKDDEIFRDERTMEGCFRRLADRLRLTDAERIEMFAAVRRWVVADRRLDPNFDRADPDAKRLVN